MLSKITSSLYFTGLCSAGYCLNGGSCMGENICLCTRGYYGARCEHTGKYRSIMQRVFVNMVLWQLVWTYRQLSIHKKLLWHVQLCELKKICLEGEGGLMLFTEETPHHKIKRATKSEQIETVNCQAL